jgi:MFS family permease
LGTRLTVTIGGSFLVLGTFLSSFAQSVPELFITYGIFFGIGLGLSYPGPMLCAVRWRPQSKNFVTGIIVSGIGGGAFIFGIFTDMLVNPNSVNTSHSGYFDPDGEVSNNVPSMFRTLALIYALMILAAITLISDPPADGPKIYSVQGPSYSAINDVSKEINVPPSRLIHIPLAWQLASCMVLTAIGTMYLAGDKNYYLPYVYDKMN